MIWVGTSGYNYPEWKGHFYPPSLPAAKMLPYYAERFTTVEINYTFYRLPTEKIALGWAAQVPEAFRFTLKAPKRITHDRKLVDCGELLRTFCQAAGALGPRLGVLLFQLGPAFKADVPRLEAFLAELPPGARAAFEFRHASWFDEAVYEALRARNAALCIADSEKLSTPVVATASFGYFRLRDEGYQEADLARWASIVRQHGDRWEDAYVYFKHEDEGKGPAFGQAFVRLLETM